jgi:hypothetical protein
MKKEKTQKSKLDWLIVGAIVVVALAVRLYKINTPLADFHSWRQADTASVARNYVKNGINLMLPKYDDLSNVQSGLENPNGYRMVEFPLYNAAIAEAELLIPSVSLEMWGRIITIVSSLVSLGLIYYLTLKEVNRLSATFAALLYAALPFNIYFTRVVLPESMALALVLGSIATLHLFTGSESRVRQILLYLSSAVLFCLALLVKPTVIFFGVALLYLFFRKYKHSTLMNPLVYLYFFLAVAPFVLWRRYILQYPEGIPYSEWLITSINNGNGLQSIFFKPAFFRWIFFERINNIILGGYLTVFLVVGMIARQKKYFLHSLFVATAAYLLVFQGGNVQHEYYQTLIIPTICIFTGIGIEFFYRNSRQFMSAVIVAPVITMLIIFSLLMSYYHVITYYGYSQDLVTISSIINSLTMPSDKIVTDTTGDTTLLYLADRHGSPSVFKDLGELQKDGYNYFVTQNEEVAKKVKKETKFQLVFQNSKVSIFKL